MHTIAWHTPRPLWRNALEDGADRTRFHRPEVLRFATDTFMEDLQSLLETDQTRVADLVVRTESWRDPATGWRPLATHEPQAVVKLYQPAHQRFYLVTASLVCQVRGLPDKSVDAAREETTSFVIRRIPINAQGQLLQAGTVGYFEYGWFGPEEGWRKLDDPDRVDLIENIGGDGASSVIHREERLPLFKMGITEERKGDRRRLLAGLIPVAKREEYEAASTEGPSDPPPDPSDDPLGDPRGPLFHAAVVSTLRSLRRGLGNTAGSLTAADGRDVLAFALLDLAELLHDPALAQAWGAVTSGSWSGTDADQQNVFNQLNGFIGSSSVRWRQAIVDVYENRDAILDGARDAENPLDLLVDDLSSSQIQTGIANLVGSAPPPPAPETSIFVTRMDAILASSPPPTREALTGAPPSTGASGEGAVYVVRCVHERPNCQVYGRSPIVSAPTQRFRMASFFDPDAPARPVRINLPVDTSIAGLRKMPKNVSVLMSDQLRKQMDRVKGISALEDEEVGAEPAWTLGMICSLSIPIITICALILLMIIVQLLNIIFWWLPFFKICLPIPLKK
jgi:hypothetical protein